MMMAALAAMLVVSAIPVAFAQDRNDRQDNRFENRVERFEDNGFFFGGNRFNEDRFDEDGFFFFGDEDRFDGDRFDDDHFDFDNGSGIGQDFDQEAESGDVDQSFDVSSTGDNSNQCVGIQGVANTGNAQNQIGVNQFGDPNRDRFDRFFFDDFRRFDR